jgi:hypothetical protein
MLLYRVLRSAKQIVGFAPPPAGLQLLHIMHLPWCCHQQLSSSAKPHLCLLLSCSVLPAAAAAAAARLTPWWVTGCPLWSS